MAIYKLQLICLLLWICIVDASHFRGGTITWRPLNNTPSGGSVAVQIRQRYSWRRSSQPCTDADIAAKNTVGGGSCTCVSGTCSSYTTLTTAAACTDYSAFLDVSSGENYYTEVFPLNIAFSISFAASAWFGYLVVGANGAWAVTNRIITAIRPDGYLNTSPVAVSLPIIYKEINVQQVHVVQMSDFDGTDRLVCRWSTSSSTITNYDECNGICSGVPGATLTGTNCTIVFTLTQAYYYAGVALQIEDFYGASTTPMSSVPLQFLFYGYPAPTGCTTPPAIIGSRPNRACIGTPIGANITELVIVQVYCPGKSITDFISSSPTGLTKSAILNPSPGIYELILNWIPVADQYGPQSFCAGAIDNTNIQSNQWCITFLVGFQSPDVIRPKTVQGSASPIGTVFKNQTFFSIQTSTSVGRPTRNGTNIYFTDATTNTLVYQFDCGYDPNVTFTGYTIVIKFRIAEPWTPGHFYYVTFDSGVASGTEFCGPESAAITDPTFWVFNIWNPAVSSTTTTSTPTPTTHTVTTLGLSTSTVNASATTTGIVVTTTTPQTTTAQPTTTSTTSTTPSTTSGPTAPPTTTISTVAVMYPKQFEEICKQPVIIMTAVAMAALIPLQVSIMFATFTKLANIFDPSKKNARLRHQQRMRNIMRR